MAIRVSVVAAALALSANMAMAQGLEGWGTAGGWDVMIDPGLGDGCLIQADYGDGSVVRIGFNLVAGEGYVAGFNHGWEGVEHGQTYPLLFALDGQEYDAEGQGLILNGVPGVYIGFDNEDFLWDLARKYTMTLYNENGEVMAIDLEGSYAGLEAVMECQDDMG